jgi:hypothetical protein
MTEARSTPYVKLAGADPAELAERLKLDDEARALLAPDLTVDAYVGRLNGAGRYPAAMTVLAHALPKREAVWWACVAVRKAGPPIQGSPAAEALAGAETWVRRPTEENRRSAHQTAQRAGLDTPSAWAAMAAFWSGDNMAPPGAPTVTPGKALTGKAVAAAVMLAAVQREPQFAPDKFRAFTASALDIARGGDGRGTTALASPR